MKIIKEVVFWTLSALVLSLGFGRSYGSYTHSFYFVAFLMPVIIGTSYTFSDLLVPHFLLKKRYLKFSLYTLYTIVISLNLEMLVITLAFAILANYQYEHLLPAAKNIFTLAITMYFITLLKSFWQVVTISMSEQQKIQLLEEKQANAKKGYLMVKADRKDQKILLEDIEYVESLSDYVKLHLIGSHQTIITKEKISSLERKLPIPFIRIHRSYIVNTDKINSITAEYVVISKKELPVSRTYKKAVQQFLKKK